MVRSFDPESTTMISSAHFTLSSVRGRFDSSFIAIIATDSVLRIEARINQRACCSLRTATRVRFRSRAPRYDADSDNQAGGRTTWLTEHVTSLQIHCAARTFRLAWVNSSSKTTKNGSGNTHESSMHGSQSNKSVLPLASVSTNLCRVS